MICKMCDKWLGNYEAEEYEVPEPIVFCNDDCLTKWYIKRSYDLD